MKLNTEHTLKSNVNFIFSSTYQVVVSRIIVSFVIICVRLTVRHNPVFFVKNTHNSYRVPSLPYSVLLIP